MTLKELGIKAMWTIEEMTNNKKEKHPSFHLGVLLETIKQKTTHFLFHTCLMLFNSCYPYRVGDGIVTF